MRAGAAEGGGGWGGGTRGPAGARGGSWAPAGRAGGSGFVQRASEAGGLRLEGLEGPGGDPGSDRYLNRSDRRVWEGKKSAGTGQAFRRLCEKGGCWGCGHSSPFWGPSVGGFSAFPRGCDNT